MRDYFSHDYNARNDKKVINLFMKHGLLGIGAFWCIVEMLYEEGGYLLRNEYGRITFELRSEYDIIKSVIEDFDLFEFDEKKFWSNTALERLKKRSEISNKARGNIEKRWKKYKSNTPVLQSKKDGNTSKVNKSKINKKIYIYSEFYDLVIENLKTDFELNAGGVKYIEMIKWLYGDNDSGFPLSNLLKLEHQLSYNQYVNLIKAEKDYNVIVKNVFMNMENRKTLTKEYKSVYNTALNWMKRNSNKIEINKPTVNKSELRLL